MTSYLRNQTFSHTKNSIYFFWVRFFQFLAILKNKGNSELNNPSIKSYMWMTLPFIQLAVLANNFFCRTKSKFSSHENRINLSVVVCKSPKRYLKYKKNTQNGD